MIERCKKHIIDHNPFGVQAPRRVKKDRPVPQDTGVTFVGVRVYVMSAFPEDGEVCGKWLLQQPGPVRADKELIRPSSFKMAITSLQYVGCPIALGTDNGERIGQFMRWMAGIIGSPPAPKNDVIVTRN